MSGWVFAIILIAAALHASWNALVKHAVASDTDGAAARSSTLAVATAAAAIAAPLLPLLPAPAKASWPFLAVSTGLQVIYFGLVARVYRSSDMSIAYPLMRGGAPLIVALVGETWFGERLSALGWLGVSVLCAGVLVMALDLGSAAWAGRLRGVALALSNAAVIAAYTLVDGLGVRRSATPAAYVLWLFFLTGITIAAWSMLARRRQFLEDARRLWRPGLAGGAGATASYGLALWAMTRAPVAMVAALRETSILFGAAISAVWLRERIGPARLAAVAIIALGAATLRLA